MASIASCWNLVRVRGQFHGIYRALGGVYNLRYKPSNYDHSWSNRSKGVYVMFIRFPNGVMLNTAHIKKIYPNFERKYDRVLGDYVLLKPEKVTIEYISHKSSRDANEYDLEDLTHLMCDRVEDVNEFLDWLYDEIKGETNEAMVQRPQ